MVDIKQVFCKRCGYSWWPRSPSIPVTCPRCHSPYWSRERVRRAEPVTVERATGLSDKINDEVNHD